MDSKTIAFTPLRISTLVTTGHLGTNLLIPKIFEQFAQNCIPIGYPDEGFLKIEFGEKAIGSFKTQGFKKFILQSSNYCGAKTA